MLCKRAEVARGMRFLVKVEWQEEEGTRTSAELGQINSNALQVGFPSR